MKKKKKTHHFQMLCFWNVGVEFWSLIVMHIIFFFESKGFSSLVWDPKLIQDGQLQ